MTKFFINSRVSILLIDYLLVKVMENSGNYTPHMRITETSASTGPNR